MNPSRLLIPALSLTLVLSWGSLYYAFAMLAHAMQAELHWSGPSVMGAYSVALLVWGLCSYPVGRIIDRCGGRMVMTLGSCLCGVLFVALSRVESLWAFYGVWAGLGAGMALTLYEPAFAVLVEAWPNAYRRRMGALTLAGGLASTAFWPLTHALAATLGWRDTVLVYAAIHLLVCAPLHWFVLPTSQPRGHLAQQEGSGFSAVPQLSMRLAMRSTAFWLLTASFAAFGFVTSAIATHAVAMIESRGTTTAAALAIAALIGPMQVASRSTEILLAHRLNPLTTGSITVMLVPFAVLALWAASSTVVLLYAFAGIYGVGLGLLTIVRATTPVEIFGAGGYASMSGALNGPSVLARAAGPLAGTFLIALHHSYSTVLLVLLACAVGGAAAYVLAIRRGTS